MCHAINKISFKISYYEFCIIIDMNGHKWDDIQLSINSKLFASASQI